MKWNETIASKARYGDVAERIFGNAEILWEESTNDYQGNCNVLAKLPDGKIAHYAWDYGSCSGCDSWEKSGMSDDDIEAEMRRTMATFSDEWAAHSYLRNLKAAVDALDKLRPAARDRK